jgi:molecular chaperone DnaK (HSP70)
MLNGDESQRLLVSDLPAEKRGIGVGIDLGTTNSAVAILVQSSNSKNMEHEQRSDPRKNVEDSSYALTPKILSIPNNGRTIPSVVSILSFSDEQSPTILVGKEAIQMEYQFPYSSYRNVKRILGTGGKQAIQNGATLVPNFVSDYNTVKSNKKILTTPNAPQNSLSQQLEEAKTMPAKLSLQLQTNNNTGATTNLTPEYISSCILKALFRAVEEETGETVTRAVIGVPAFFNDAQREATQQACIMAGVKKVRLIREPEAAALAYGLGKDMLRKDNFEDELVLVFDLGGGTFDVSVLAVGGGLMEVVATTGNSMLGGSDFDRRIAAWITNEISKSTATASNSPWVLIESVQSAILRSAEAVRIHLTNNRQVKLKLPLSMDGWLNMTKPTNIILYQDEMSSTTANNTSTSPSLDTQAPYYLTELSRKSMEDLCTHEFQSLLPPVREVALLAGVLLPGDAPPSVAEAASQIEKDWKGSSPFLPLEYDDFYDETANLGNSGVNLAYDINKNNTGDETLDQDALLLIRNMDLKEMRARQKGGRKKARDLAARERTFRREKLRAETNFNRDKNQNRGNVKVQRSSYGRLLSQVVLVGGATRMPAIGRMLTALTGVTPQKTVNPDEAVALGAAIQVGILDGDDRLGDMQVLNPMQAAVLRAFAKKRQLLDS